MNYFKMDAFVPFVRHRMAGIVRTLDILFWSLCSDLSLGRSFRPVEFSEPAAEGYTFIEQEKINQSLDLLTQHFSTLSVLSTFTIMVHTKNVRK